MSEYWSEWDGNVKQRHDEKKWEKIPTKFEFYVLFMNGDMMHRVSSHWASTPCVSAPNEHKKKHVILRYNTHIEIYRNVYTFTQTDKKKKQMLHRIIKIKEEIYWIVTHMNHHNESLWRFILFPFGSNPPNYQHSTLRRHSLSLSHSQTQNATEGNKNTWSNYLLSNAILWMKIRVCAWSWSRFGQSEAS